MAERENCYAELVAGEVKLCYPCSNASREERERRHEAAMRARGVVVPTKPKPVNLLNPNQVVSGARIRISQPSGQILSEKLMLFPQYLVLKVMDLQAQARKELGGFSSGIGFWGSPEWALLGAGVLGLAESVISGAKAKNGVALLQEAAQVTELMRSRGKFFQPCEIANIWLPEPGLWKAQGVDPDREEPVLFTHSGDEFIWIENEGGRLAIRWASVENFALI
jgi:hypothetical protein